VRQVHACVPQIPRSRSLEDEVTEHEFRELSPRVIPIGPIPEAHPRAAPGRVTTLHGFEAPKPAECRHNTAYPASTGAFTATKTLRWCRMPSSP
jgi:hypothetical protein